MRRVGLLGLAGLVGCANVTGVEDGARLNSVVQVKDWFTSVFVVPTDEGAVLIDGGFRAGVVESGLAALDLTPADITDVLLTHGHADHLAVAAELPDARVWALPEEHALIAEETDGGVTPGAIADGDALELGGALVEVFAVPGHTEGSAVYLVDGVLLLGDCALVDRGGALVSVPEDRSDDPEAAVESLRTLADRLAPRAEEIDWLAPSHSAALAGFEALGGF